MLSVIFAYVTTIYNLIRINFLNWLDVSGFNNDNNKIKWIYYTYLGRKYRFPLQKLRRGPQKPDLELEEFFANETDTLHQLKGPLGDYHGQLQLIKQIYGISPDPKNDTVYNPFPTQAELLFKSEGRQITTLIHSVLNNIHFQDAVELAGLNYSRLLIEIYDLLDDEIRQLAFERQSLNKLDERLDFRQYSQSTKTITKFAMELIDQLKTKKEELGEDFEIFTEICKMAEFPQSFAIMIRDYLVNRKLNTELFATFMTDLKTKYGFDFAQQFNQNNEEEGDDVFTRYDPNEVIQEVTPKFVLPGEILTPDYTPGTTPSDDPIILRHFPIKDAFGTPSETPTETPTDTPLETPDNLTPRTSYREDLSSIVKEDYEDREPSPEIDVDENGVFILVDKDGNPINKEK